MKRHFLYWWSLEGGLILGHLSIHMHAKQMTPMPNDCSECIRQIGIKWTGFAPFASMNVLNYSLYYYNKCKYKIILTVTDR